MNIETDPPPWGPRYDPIWPTAHGMGTTDIIYWCPVYLGLEEEFADWSEARDE